MSSERPIPAPERSVGQTLSVQNLRLTRREPDGSARVLLDVERFELAAGGRIALAGASGAGKTTLLSLLGGLERADEGSIRWDGFDLARAGSAQRDRWRRRNVGIVFQEFRLIDELDAVENVLLPTRFDRWRTSAESRAFAHKMLGALGVPVGRSVDTLSRGERQRCAIARAVLGRPKILIADEPTASLDSESGAQVGALLIALADDLGATMIVATHDGGLAARMDKTVRVQHGRIAF
ncbi:MAG: transporter ATP-binding protein [Rhodospirillales bacterium]|nr:transporter ATP-binding protein [Rhodospirillales bacterium]